MLQHTVTAEEDGRVLRDILRQVMKLSYSAMKAAKWSGRIAVNGAARTVDQRVSRGDLITITDSVSTPAYLPLPCPLPVTVVWEDEYFSIIDKPAPLPVQCGKDRKPDTLENAWFSRLGCPESFVFRPVNRLDKGTSGLMVIARTAHSQAMLQSLLHSGSFRREYMAVTEGIPSPASGMIDLPIAKEDAASVRRIVTSGGKPARTHYDTLKTAGNRALVHLRLDTGRTHQIRVHLAHIGCPVAGDFLYGTELQALPGRFALHSCLLQLVHPVTGEVLRLTSQLPPELQDLLNTPEKA